MPLVRLTETYPSLHMMKRWYLGTDVIDIESIVGLGVGDCQQTLK